MHTGYHLGLALLAALALGCGKQETPRSAATRPAQEVERLGSKAARAAERQANQMQDEWKKLANDVDATVRKTQAKATGQVKQVRKQTNDLAEYAAEMAEDAKDRALDIPDVLDEFFGDEGSSRANLKRGSRDNRSRR
jgi:ElaB/YqjD/DUF883 family membrane-anchored ribosome-binding protein